MTLGSGSPGWLRCYNPGLWGYVSAIEFYTKVAQVADRIVMVNFRDVISDFGQVIERVNSKFGTSFGVFEHTP